MTLEGYVTQHAKFTSRVRSRATHNCVHKKWRVHIEVVSYCRSSFSLFSFLSFLLCFHLFLFFSLALLHLYISILYFFLHVLFRLGLSLLHVFGSLFFLAFFVSFVSSFLHYFPSYDSFYIRRIGLTVIYRIVFDRFSLWISTDTPARVADIFVVFLCLQQV
jgi:hypothetical protein